MRAFGWLLLVFGCSGGTAVPSDAGPDGDVGPDADACVVDTDGDGHCDTRDTCPDVADPAQHDLDQDGIGWVCDPVESVMFAGGDAIDLGGSVSSDKAAAVVRVCDTVACDRMIFAASNTGSFLVDTASTPSADGWAAATEIKGPLITNDAQVLFSRRKGVTEGDTVAVDPATKAIELRSAKMIDRVLRDGLGGPVLVSLEVPPQAAAHLVEPRGGDRLHLIAPTFTEEWFETDSPGFFDAYATEANPFVSKQQHSSPSTFTLQIFQPGSDSFAELDPPVVAATRVRRIDEGRGARWCVTTSGASSYYEPTATGIKVVPIPFQDCAPQLLEVREFPGTTLFIGTGDPNGDGTFGRNVAFERGGIVHDLGIDETAAFRVRTSAHDAIVISFDPFQEQQPSRVWVIWPNNTFELLANDLAAVDISAANSTVHVIGVRSGGGTRGPLIVRRFKPGQPTQEAQLAPDVSIVADNRIVTSVEGAAIASSTFDGWIAPSNQLTFSASPLGFRELAGGARGSNTVVFADVPDSFGGGDVYAYDEVNGEPRLTLLATNMFTKGMLFHPNPSEPSEYFVLRLPQGCKIGRLQASANGPPTLQTFDCANAPVDANAPDGFRFAGVSREGERVVVQNAPDADKGLFAISDAGVRTLAVGDLVVPIVDNTQAPGLLVGWVSVNTIRSLVCIDEQPLRCWSAPPNARVLDTRIDRVGGQLEISTLLLDSTSTANRFTVVRSIGPGTAQP